MRKNKKKKVLKQIITLIIFIILLIITSQSDINIQEYLHSESEQITVSYNIGEIPEYENEPYVIINNNIPNFEEEDYTTESFETYSKLDKLGRCGVAYANICQETMPSADEERESISSIKPSGWKNVKYGDEYLYNRCHLIRMATSFRKCK